MPDPVPSHRVIRPRTLALRIAAAIAISTTATATLSHRSPGAVTVDYIPPDACVAVYGPGPCREHGQTIIGLTDAVAGPPPGSWRGKVETRVSARL